MRLRTKLLLILVSLVLFVTAGVIAIVKSQVEAHERRRIAWEIETSAANFDRLEGEQSDELTLHVPTWFQIPQVVTLLDNYRTPVDFLQVAVPFLQSVRFDDADAFGGVFVFPPEEESMVLLYPPPPIDGDPTYDERKAELEHVRSLLDDAGFRARLPLSEILFDARVFPRIWRVHGSRLFRILAMPIETFSRPGEPVAAMLLVREATDRYAAEFILRSSEPPPAPPPESAGWRSHLGLVPPPTLSEACDAVFVVGDRVVASTRRDLPGLDDLAGAFRDAVAAGETGTIELSAGGERLLGQCRALPTQDGDPPAGFIVFKSYDQALIHLDHTVALLGRLGAGVTFLAVIIAVIVTSGIVRPVRRLVGGTKAIESGRLDVEVPVTTRDEIGDLTRSFNHMVAELRLKERIKDQFGKYLDPRIVKDLIGNPTAAKLGGDKRVMTVYFSDVAGFTSISESMSPETLVHLLNEYFTLMTDAIVAHEGIVDKFIGDAIMAFWGPPFVPAGRHASAACFAAVDQMDWLEVFRRRLVERSLPPIEMRIGISTGEMIVGNVGSEGKQGYTVIGDRVNLASRLEGANKAFGTRILVDEPTARAAADVAEFREIDEIQVKGKDEAVRVFEIMAGTGRLSERQAALRERYAMGLAAYRAREVIAAREHFQACLAIEPADGPSSAFLDRLQELATTRRERDFSTVWRLKEK